MVLLHHMNDPLSIADSRSSANLVAGSEASPCRPACCAAVRPNRWSALTRGVNSRHTSVNLSAEDDGNDTEAESAARRLIPLHNDFSSTISASEALIRVPISVDSYGNKCLRQVTFCIYLMFI